MVPLKTSTTMLLLASQNVARPEVPTPSHSTTDCSLHRTGTSPRPIHFAKFSTQYSSLSRCLLLTRCQLSHLFHRVPYLRVSQTPGFTPISPDCNQFTSVAPSSTKEVFWLLRDQHRPKPHRLQVCHTGIKNLDLSSLAEPCRLTFYGESAHPTSGSRW